MHVYYSAGVYKRIWICSDSDGVGGLRTGVRWVWWQVRENAVAGRAMGGAVGLLRMADWGLRMGRGSRVERDVSRSCTYR